MAVKGSTAVKNIKVEVEMVLEESNRNEGNRRNGSTREVIGKG